MGSIVANPAEVHDVIFLTLPLDTVKSLNRTNGMHWRGRHNHKKRVAWDVLRALPGGRPAVPFERAQVTIHRYAPRHFDHDNFVGGCKAVIDGLVTCGVIADDSTDVIGRPDCLQVKVPGSEARVVVRVVGC